MQTPFKKLLFFICKIKPSYFFIVIAPIPNGINYFCENLISTRDKV